MIFSDCQNDKYGYRLSHIYYPAQELFEAYPQYKFDEAEVIIEGEDNIPNLPKKFYYNNFYIKEGWVVKNFKGRHYCIILKEHWLKGISKMEFTRYYMPGEKRQSRKVNRVSYEKIQADTQVADNSCQIFTLSCVTEQPYSKILENMRDHGWNEGRTRKVIKNGGELWVGTLRSKSIKDPSKTRWELVLAEYGKAISLIWERNMHWGNFGQLSILPKNKGLTVKSAAKVLPKGTYVLKLNSHVLVVKDNVIFDNVNSINRHVIAIYKIEDV
jgi:hypothetical protein